MDWAIDKLVVVAVAGTLFGLWRIVWWAWALLRPEWEAYAYLSGPVMLVVGIIVFVRYELPRARK